jgi:hypothetical protein
MTENYTMVPVKMREGKITKLMNMFKDMHDLGYSFDPLTGIESWALPKGLKFDILMLRHYQVYCGKRGIYKLRDILEAINLGLFHGIYSSRGDTDKWFNDKLEKELRMKIKSCKREGAMRGVSVVNNL